MFSLILMFGLILKTQKRALQRERNKNFTKTWTVCVEEHAENNQFHD